MITSPVTEIDEKLARPELVEPGAEHGELDRLADRIVELSAQIQAATYQLLVLIHEFDERGGWGGGGFLSCAHWLNWRAGIGVGTAREKVRVAHALARLPLISEAMRNGEVSYSKVRAMTRVATPETEGGLLEFAVQGSAAHVERLIRGWRRIDRLEEAKRDARRLRSHSLRMWFDEDGMLVLDGRLDPETGAVVKRALEAAEARLRERDTESQRAADARSAYERGPVDLDDEPYRARQADALKLVAESALAADLDPGTRSDRYLVTVHVDAPVLEEPVAGETHREGMALLADGVDVSAGTSRRLSCDASKVIMTHDSDGNVLDVGRRTRTIPVRLRRALNHRDGTCRFPGCGVRICDGHHVRHWADGGETKLENLVLLCRRHHVAVHEGGYRVTVESDGRARFFHEDGREFKAAPGSVKRAWDSATVLGDVLAVEGVNVDGRTGSARTLYTECDYGLALSILREPLYEHEPARTEPPARGSEESRQVEDSRGTDMRSGVRSGDVAVGEPVTNRVSRTDDEDGGAADSGYCDDGGGSVFDLLRAEPDEYESATVTGDPPVYDELLEMQGWEVVDLPEDLEEHIRVFFQLVAEGVYMRSGPGGKMYREARRS